MTDALRKWLSLLPLNVAAPREGGSIHERVIEALVEKLRQEPSEDPLLVAEDLSPTVEEFQRYKDIAEGWKVRPPKIEDEE